MLAGTYEIRACAVQVAFLPSSTCRDTSWPLCFFPSRGFCSGELRGWVLEHGWTQAAGQWTWAAPGQVGRAAAVPGRCLRRTVLAELTLRTAKQEVQGPCGSTSSVLRGRPHKPVFPSSPLRRQFFSLFLTTTYRKHLNADHILMVFTYINICVPEAALLTMPKWQAKQLSACGRKSHLHGVELGLCDSTVSGRAPPSGHVCRHPQPAPSKGHCGHFATTKSFLPVPSRDP